MTLGLASGPLPTRRAIHVAPLAVRATAIDRFRAALSAALLGASLSACVAWQDPEGGAAAGSGALGVAAPALVVATPAVADLESALQEILLLLPGRYRGAGGDGGQVFHKIVPIVAPQFAASGVFYHQISRDGFDSTAPAQQKIYVFDRSPGRETNLMRSYVFLPRQGYANFEADAVALRTVRPDMLMSFPPSCGIRWSRGEAAGQYVARSRSNDCSFEGVVFKQRIRPNMTYVLDRHSFSVEDVLYGENGQPLFPRTGLLRAARTTP